MTKPTEAMFLKDVAEHQIIVLRDDGLYRHIRFRRPETYCMGFDLVTWPGYLAYCGDMGEFVFTRIEDMFQFFRSDSGRINPGYWSEKCRAADTSGTGVEEYSAESFRDAIECRLDNMEANTALREAVRDELLPLAEDGEHEAMRAALDFEHDGELVFQDFWEARCRDYTYRFIWCCYALAWSIRKYDAMKDAHAPKSDPK